MDIRDEMSLSKDDPSPKSSSLRVSDQNKHRNKLLGSGVTKYCAQHGEKSQYVQPVSEFNPSTGIQVLQPLVKDKLSVKKSLVIWDKVKVKASVKKPVELSEFVSKKRRRRTELPKLNALADVADKESDVVNNKDKESNVADKESDMADKELDKRRRRTELPKVNAPAAMADKSLVEKSVVKAAVKPAVKPAVNGNESKKLKSKSGMKRKIKNSSDSFSSSVKEKKLRHLLKKLKNIKQEDSDESVSDRKMKYKKKKKELTPSEAAHEEYLKHYLTLRFNSFHNLAIDEIPSRVGRFCVANFNSFTYKLSLDSGDSIHVTPSKIHDIFREKLELDAHVLGLLELNDESTGGGSMVTSEKEVKFIFSEEKLSIVFSERVFLEGSLMTASEKYPGDRKFLEIHQKYAEVFKNPIEFGYHESSLGDDGNGDDDTGNGDDDDRNGDDDDVNEDDYV
ncbi:hypothetical protein Tco_0881161 [Tanacetum coccineum]